MAVGSSSTVAASTAPTSARSGGPGEHLHRKTMRAWLLVAVLALVGLLAFLLTGIGAEFDEATIGLTVAGAALLFCLHSLYRMVSVLGRTNIDVELEQEVDPLGNSPRRLREERRRLLRAIHELEFDFQMGKLSEADYTQVREAYELRTIEVMRALDAEAEIDPVLAEELRRRGLHDEAMVGPPPEVPPPEDPPGDPAVTSGPEPTPAGDPGDAEAPEDAPHSEAAVNACAECGKANDVDARFCKHCGKELKA